MAVMTRVRKALNAFLTFEQEKPDVAMRQGPSSGLRQSQSPKRYSSERSLVNSVYTRIAIDVAAVEFRHVNVDGLGRYSSDVKSRLNMCFDLEPNIDQGPRAFRQDVVRTFLDNGASSVVPVDYAIMSNGDLEIYSMRVGVITEFFHHRVRMSLYDENFGDRKEITLDKRNVAIIENPLYAVMNEPNSTLQRLIRKLNTLDDIDSGAAKLDLIIQLPYAVKGETQQDRAAKRLNEIEFQLKEAEYGIAYVDGTEKITQLNRGADNQLLKQVEYLTQLLYSQLGITESVMDGTADEKTMLNYRSRTVYPMVDAIKDAYQRAFLGEVRFTRGERIKYFKNPFELVPIEAVADVADKFSRNEILSPNEIRSFMGIAPSDDPKADKLENSNMPAKPSEDPNQTESTTDEGDSAS